MEYIELRNKYLDFYYHDYEIQEDDHEVKIIYTFEIKGLSFFNPTFTLKKVNTRNVSNLKVFKEAAFSLGLVELISYWKITCAPHVHIECGSLDDIQKKWWKKLYFNGLGEFFYINHIETDIESFMDITTSGKAMSGEEDTGKYHGNLIPVGGGKDSFVSLSILEEMKKDNHAFVINKVMSAVHSAEAAGYTGEYLINPIRTLDSRMLELNKQGYLNGHTPFSAMAAFASVITSIVYEKEYICLSNEASANESTIKGSKVNHQYSKTFEFEEDFKFYMDHYITDKIHYFSLLRPLSELQITYIFSSLKAYHSVFRSCNVGSKEEKWCGKCAKCLFVAIMLSAFISDEEIEHIFGKGILNDPELESLFEQLTGISVNKPFECVGTRDEVNIATSMCIARHIKENKECPYLYKKYKESSFYAYYKDAQLDVNMWNKENLVPEEYQTLIHKKIRGIAKC